MAKPGSYMDDIEPAFNADISVETALNSRCSSDNDGDPKNFHWGMYNSNTHIPPEYLDALERGLQIPRYTLHQLNAELEERPIVLSMSNTAMGIEREWLHIESGMQHQAAHLVCAAVGMGTCIYNLGTDGTPQRTGLLGTVRMGLEMMYPSYNGSLWTTDAPDEWIDDPSLPEPGREGSVPLLQAMEDASTSNRGRNAEWQDVSQLLWAARGRTPHYIMSKPCGLTIPTWAGGQNIASLYLATKDGIYRYVNMIDGKPTHAITKIADSYIKDAQIQIIMCVNENNGRALWETGYMLESLILQATALKIRFDSQLTDAEVRRKFESCGLPDTRAVFSVYL